MQKYILKLPYKYSDYSEEEIWDEIMYSFFAENYIIHKIIVKSDLDGTSQVVIYYTKLPNI